MYMWFLLVLNYYYFETCRLVGAMQVRPTFWYQTRMTRIHSKHAHKKNRRAYKNIKFKFNNTYVKFKCRYQGSYGPWNSKVLEKSWKSPWFLKVLEKVLDFCRYMKKVLEFVWSMIKAQFFSIHQRALYFLNSNLIVA